MAADTTTLLRHEANGGVANVVNAATSINNLEHPDITADWLRRSAQYCEAHWYAAYTSANHEKRVAGQLDARSVEHFLPLYASVRRWKDRRITLKQPLFPGYVFVRIPLRDRLRVQQIPGVAYLVGFNGAPAPLRDDEIELLRLTMNGPTRIQPHPYLIRGCRVRIRYGPMRGLEGVLLRRSKPIRVVLSVNLIASSVAVEVDASDVERIG